MGVELVDFSGRIRKREVIFMIVAEQIVKVLEERGVKFVFGLPGEENINLVNELNASENIQFILVHDEQSAAFMGEVIGWLTGKPGVCVATLGPGALNLVLGAADAQSHSFPLIVLAAQGSLESLSKETTQVVDLKSLYSSVTKWSENLIVAESTAELLNKAYNLAVNGRPGATFLTIPDSLEREKIEDTPYSVISNPREDSIPTEQKLAEAAALIKEAEQPIILIGLGAVRDQADQAVRNFVEKYDVPAATTFMAKGVISDKTEQSLGTVGFFVDDYSNQMFYESDLIISIGYEFSEFGAEKINPEGDKRIIHIHNFNQDTDKNYSVSVNLIGSIQKSVDLLSEKLSGYHSPAYKNQVKIKLKEEYEEGKQNSAAPLSPVQIVHATRQALGGGGRALVDTGAVKMWMARLFPTYRANSVLINNGLSTMAWTIPGTIAAKLAYPEIPILTVTGDGSFLMGHQEIITAKRYNIPLTILIWDDSGYGLIKWKMDMSLDQHSEVDFKNPDFIKLAESYGGTGYVAEDRDDLEKTLADCLEADDGINVIVAPVDYSANMELTNHLQKELQNSGEE